MIDTVYKNKDPNKLNAWLKNIWNNYFLNKHELFYTTSIGENYKIMYHRFYWFWQDKWSVKKTLKNFHYYHYEVSCMFENGGSCSMDRGIEECWFTKKKMTKILHSSAEYWSKVCNKNSYEEIKNGKD